MQDVGVQAVSAGCYRRGEELLGAVTASVGTDSHLTTTVATAERRPPHASSPSKATATMAATTALQFASIGVNREELTHNSATTRSVFPCRRPEDCGGRSFRPVTGGGSSSVPRCLIIKTRAKLLYSHCRALLRNKYDSGILLVAAAFVISLVVLEQAYLSFAPLPAGCPSRHFSRSAGVPLGCEPVYHVSVWITIARYAVCGASLAGLWLQRAIYNHATATGPTDFCEQVVHGFPSRVDRGSGICRHSGRRSHSSSPSSSSSPNVADITDCSSSSPPSLPSPHVTDITDNSSSSSSPSSSLNWNRYRERTRLSDVRIWSYGTAGWAAASSRQVWLEVCSAVYGSVMFMLGTTLSQSLLLAGVNLITEFSNESWHRGASWDYACRTCSDGDTGSGQPPRDSVVETCMSTGHAPLNFCFLTWQLRVLLPLLLTGQVISLGILTSFTVMAVWDPVAVTAGARTGLQWLDRVRKMHFVLAPSLLHLAFPLVVIQGMELHVSPRVLVEAAGFSSLVFVTLQVGLTVWVLQRGNRQQPVACCDAVDDDGGESGVASRSMSINRDDGNNENAARCRPSLWASSRRQLMDLLRALYDAFLRESASMHVKRMYLAMLILLSFSMADVSYGLAYCTTIAIIRNAWVIIFVITHDKPDTFADLKRDPNGAGFGLVVDACLLREALQRYLSNRNDGTTQQHSPPLPTYKATLYRMEATLAVSYRWQDREACICPGLNLNMSRWQMEQLVNALGSTSCFYVWIDRMSVPQYECELQNTLLARMMATYASARETLVLRSAERAGSRYHQRAWTLPEFVCSTSPRICTELSSGDEDDHACRRHMSTPSSSKSCDNLGPQMAWAVNQVDGDDDKALASVTTTEERHVAAVRQHYVQRLPSCVPLWLQAEGEVRFGCQVLSAWDTYSRTCDSLNCTVPEDRIRAVYPLLFCVPVEDHDEMVRLVDAVASVLEREVPGSIASATARRHYYQIAGAAVVDIDDDSDYSCEVIVITGADEENNLSGRRRGFGFLGSALSSTASLYSSTKAATALISTIMTSSRRSAISYSPSS